MTERSPDQQGGRDEVERRLAETLHGQLDGLNASSDLTAPAIKRSRRLRRNRARLAGAASAVAALVVAAPFVVNGLRESGLTGPGPARSTIAELSSSGTTTPAPSTTTPAPSTTSVRPTTPAPTVDADAAPLATVRPSFGAAARSPAVSYVHGTTVHDVVRDHQATLEVPADSQIGAVNGLFADGSVLGTVLSDGDWAVVIWDGVTGAERTRLSTGTVLAFDSDRTRAAYSDSSERLHVIDSTGDVVATAPRAGLLASGIIGDVVFANDIRSEQRQGYTWNLATGALKRFDGRFGPAHSGAGLVVFRPTGAGDDACFRILDATAQLAVRWTGCGDFSPDAFSSSGGFLVGGLRIDGGAPYDLWVMRSSDGKRVLRVDGNPSGLMLNGRAVSDRDESITVVAQNADLEEGLVECALDGSGCTVVGAPEPLDTKTASGVSSPVWQILP